MRTKEASSKKLIYVLVILLSIFILKPSSIFAQDSTLNNYTGNWTDNASWVNGTNPGTSVLNVNVTINGNIKHNGDLDFKNSDLTVNDTLIIFGDVSFGNNANLFISTGGVLIVYGNYTSANQVSVTTGGYLIVTGTFTQSGSNNQGSFTIDGGSVYIYDPSPGIKTGTGFTDLQCDPDCGYGDSAALTSDTISGLFSAGGYTITASGPTTFCSGGSVDLSVTDDGTFYQWLKDDLDIAGANSFIYTATSTGSYSLKMLVGTDTLLLNPVDVTVNSVSSPPASASVDRNNLCPADGNIILSYAGGTLGTNATAEWYSDATFTTNVGSGNNLTLATPGCNYNLLCEI